MICTIQKKCHKPTGRLTVFAHKGIVLPACFTFFLFSLSSCRVMYMIDLMYLNFFVMKMLF